MGVIFALADVVDMNFGESTSLLKKSLSGRSADRIRIQHCQTKAETPPKKGLRVLDAGSEVKLRGFSTRWPLPRTRVNKHSADALAGAAWHHGSEVWWDDHLRQAMRLALAGGRQRGMPPDLQENRRLVRHYFDLKRPLRAGRDPLPGYRLLRSPRPRRHLRKGGVHRVHRGLGSRVTRSTVRRGRDGRRGKTSGKRVHYDEHA
jgi:hypothetical protein